MDSYEFDCVNYSDENDKEMYWFWNCLRKVFQINRAETCQYACDKGRIKLARKAYTVVKCLARDQGGKASLLIDPELGMCYVGAENMDYFQFTGLRQRLYALRLLSSADDFTVTCGISGGSLTLKLGFRAFRRIDEPQ